MWGSLRRWKCKFYVTIATPVTVLVLLLMALLLWNVGRESKAVALSMSGRLFGELAGRAAECVNGLLGQAAKLTASCVNMPSSRDEPKADGRVGAVLPFMLHALDTYEDICSLYVGYDSGNFQMVTATRGDQRVSASVEAPAETRYVVRTITMGPNATRRQHWRFLNVDRDEIGARTEAEPAFDPRDRPWYVAGRRLAAPVFTDPYVFFESGEPGITCAQRLPDTNGVFGVDIALAGVCEFVRRLDVSAHGVVLLLDEKGRLIAQPDAAPDLPEVSGGGVQLPDGRRSGNPIIRGVVDACWGEGAARPSGTQTVIVGGAPILVRLERAALRPGAAALIAVAAPVSDFTGHIRNMQARIALFVVGALIVVLPLVLWMARRISRSLTRLGEEADRIRKLDFGERPRPASVITEIRALIEAFALMKTTIRKRTQDLMATQEKLRTLVDGGIALSAERDMALLTELTIRAAQKLSNADGGTLYLRDGEDRLRFAIMRTDSLGIAAGGTTGDDLPLQTVVLRDPDTGEENHRNVASHAALTGETVVVDDLSSDEAFEFTGVRAFDERTGYRSRSFLTVPMKPRQGDVIGVIQLINAQDPETGELVPFSPEVIGFVEALAAQAAVALDNQRLIAAQRELFEAFVKVIADAVDAKSPYTGAHCTRVPELAMLLARAAHETREGPFSTFRLETEDEWREFRMAAWLHDCGKVTTPEYIVDKATKLEAIYNRIHEVRTRFEVLWRDAEIDCLRKRLAGGEDADQLQAVLDEARRQLQEDFAFVAECNAGGEFMAEERVERLRRIGAKTWQRHFDDRLGLSRAERKRHEDGSTSGLPAAELLLADKPEHIIPRSDSCSSDETDKGFRRDVPEHLYNLGELYNLSIGRGTLTSEDRFKINEHVVQTIAMLGKLPFPDYLARVPEYAGAHHETMIGTGYPRKLLREDMSVGARIMAIADVFEALTACDRPYKKAKRLSEALNIMSHMRDDQHIDAELFDLFLTTGIYQTYAAQFLAPGQIDDVDVAQYRRPA